MGANLCVPLEPPATRIFDWDGNLLYCLREAVTVAQVMQHLMMLNFVVALEDILITGRYTALDLEEELMLGSVYIVVPIGKAWRYVGERRMRVTTSEIASAKRKKPKNRFPVDLEISTDSMFEMELLMALAKSNIKCRF